MRCLNCKKDGIPISLAENGNCPHCGVYFPSLLRNTLPIGTLLHDGKYRIDYPLGQGGFGITYRGFHTVLEQELAIKEFYPDGHALRQGNTGYVTVTAGSQDAYQRGKARFLREGKILAKLNHPNVVKVQDLFEERNTAYLVMEWIKGQTLRDILDEQPEKRLNENVIEWVMSELVSALETIHQQDVYHLDLKPDNVLITDEQRLVLIDFGSARQGFSKNSQSNQSFTDLYAAPEVILGEDVGSYSDLFELGMMLHEMLTGELPPSAFKRSFKKELKLSLGLAEPWNSLLTKALYLQPPDRPQSVSKWWRNKYNISNNEQIVIAVDFSDIISQSNAELKRIGWTQEEGQDYLIRTYGKRTRKLLSDEELLEFLDFLQKQPNNNNLSLNQSDNYVTLKDLLKAGQWEQADFETYRLMIEAVGRTQGDWIRETEIDNFPLAVLETIDQLWVKYSNGHFGFSIQTKIYQSLGGTEKYDQKIWENFGESVGWRKNNRWLSFSELKFNINAPHGYLPYIVISPIRLQMRNKGRTVGELQGFGWKFFSRIETCNIKSINIINADNHYLQGLAFYKQGKLDHAIVEYRKAIALKIDNPRVYYNLGLAFHRQKKVDEAIRQYNQAIALDPNYTKAYYQLGLAFHHQENLNDAIEYYKKAIALDPNYTKAQSKLKSALYHRFHKCKKYDVGEDVFESESFEQSLKSYQREMSRNPNSFRMGYR